MIYTTVVDGQEIFTTQPLEVVLEKHKQLDLVLEFSRQRKSVNDKTQAVINEIKGYVKEHGDIELNFPTGFKCTICNRKYADYTGTLKPDGITHYDKCITDGKIEYESEIYYENHHIDILSDILARVKQIL